MEKNRNKGLKSKADQQQHPEQDCLQSRATANTFSPRESLYMFSEIAEVLPPCSAGLSCQSCFLLCFDGWKLPRLPSSHLAPSMRTSALDAASSPGIFWLMEQPEPIRESRVSLGHGCVAKDRHSGALSPRPTPAQAAGRQTDGWASDLPAQAVHGAGRDRP